MPPIAEAQSLNGAPRARDHLKRAIRYAPYARYAARTPMLMGALAVGFAGVVAWRNRDRIAEAARPLIRSAAERGEALRDRLSFGRADHLDRSRMNVPH